MHALNAALYILLRNSLGVLLLKIITVQSAKHRKNAPSCGGICTASKKSHYKLHEIFYTWPDVAVARSFCDDNAIRYVLPVLRMTLCFHIYASAVVKQVVKLPTYSPGNTTLLIFVAVHNVSKLYTVGVSHVDMRTLPLIGGLRRAV